MNLDQLSKAELLRRIYDKLSDDEKRTFIMMRLEGKSNSEIMKVLTEQGRQITDIQQHVDKNHWLSASQ